MTGNSQLFQCPGMGSVSFFITLLNFVMTQTFFKKISSTSLTCYFHDATLASGLILRSLNKKTPHNAAFVSH